MEELKAVDELRAVSQPLSTRPDYGSIQRVANGWIQARQDADQKYKENLRDCKALLKDIDGLLTKHSREQAGNPKDWGYTGDLGHVKQLLEEPRRFLSGYGR